jgi:hypothetical protein
MTVPKTNLWRGDRVKLSRTYINSMQIRMEADEFAKTVARYRSRIGTIITDTLNPQANSIRVHWDGNAKANQKDTFMPDELTLYEEEFEHV